MSTLFVRARLTTFLSLFAFAFLMGASIHAKSPTAEDIQNLANKVDQLIEAQLAKSKVKAAPLADDAEFLRRIYLDLAGRIPTVAEARRFLQSKKKDKRALLVDELLSRSGYVTHFTHVWRDLLIPEANNSFIVKLQQNGFEAWLKDRVKTNASLAELARDLITARMTTTGPASIATSFTGQASPVAFFSAKEFRPENLAAATARVFLGLNVECAQCHNHPFANWKREQFWELAAFYSGMRSQTLMDFIVPSKEKPEQRELTIPGTSKTVQAVFLDGSKPKWKPKDRTRDALAEWVTAKSNPYFAKATVNRLWAYFHGTGLYEPIDDMVGDGTTLTHPKTLSLLAEAFTKQDFDPKFLIRVITSTRAYQRTSSTTAKGQDDQTLFAKAHLRGLTAEQLFDSVATATGYRDSGGGNDLISGILGGPRSARAEFLTRFGSTGGLLHHDGTPAGAVADEWSSHRQCDVTGEERNARRNS